MPLTISSQMLDYPRDWNCTLSEYLHKHGIKIDKATPLTGGASGYLWRLDGYLDTTSTENGQKDSVPRVIKCTDSAVKAVPEIKAPANRIFVEMRAMESEVIAEACRKEPTVRVCRLLRKTENGFVMDWAGDIDLRQAFKTDNSLDYQDIGSCVGRWLAYMHHAGISNNENWNDRSATDDPINGVGGMLEQSLQAAMEAEEFPKEKIDQAISLLRTNSGARTLTIDDFRPMNTLLNRRGKSRPDITIVDFEACHYGDPAMDLNFWVGEAMVLENKYGNKGLLSSFLTSYQQTAGEKIVNMQFVYKVVVATASFILMIVPATIWDCTEEDVKPWTQIATQYIRAAVEKDNDWLKKSAVRPLLTD